ncbi:MAG: hypothetical protein LBN18_07090 [Dysgonamonadaceae bacterium]|nr:hypothetical protein [Dysgonamonadaceae bacterium]
MLVKIALFSTCFFWDSVATLSKPSLFLYEHNFSSLNFPSDTVDDNLLLSGIMAGIWKIFGCNLIVSHLFFTIIGLIFIYQLFRLCTLFIPQANAFPFIFLLVISDPAVVTQSLLIMTDLFMLLFAVMSIRYILENRKIALTFSLLALSLLRARGLCMSAGIAFGYFVYLIYQNQWKISFKQVKQAILPFLPAILFFTGFYLYRQMMFGGYYYIREDNAWSSHYHWVNFKQLIINVAATGRCFLDYGRIFIWIVLIFLGLKFGIKRLFRKEIQIPLIFFAATFFCLLCITLPFTNPVGFRYFMLQYILVALVAGKLLFALLKEKQAKIISILLILGLWSGHFWIYPEKIPMAWDTTLAHLPYYDLRQDMLRYLDDNQIDYKETASFFPAAAGGKFIDLSTDERQFAALDFQANKYVIYSNIANWSDEDIDTVQTWIKEKEFVWRGVFIRIYRNPAK